MAKRYLQIRESKNIELYDFDGRVADVLKFIEGLKEEHGENAVIDICQIWDNTEVAVHWYRQETDVERDKRLAKARKARATAKTKAAEREEAERAELARLQAKYAAE